MNAKQKDRLVMVIVIAIVAALMAAMLWMIYSYSNGDMSEDSMYMLSAFLSGSMFFVVIIYALIIEKSNTQADRYQRFMEMERKKELEGKQKEQ